MKAANTLAERAIQMRSSSGEGMSLLMEVPKDRNILPAGFPLSSLAAYFEFNDKSKYPENQPLFDELVLWLSLCEGKTVVFAVNKMFSHTLTDELCCQLTWSTPPKGSTMVIIQGDKYITACRSAIEIIAKAGGFGSNFVVGDSMFKDAVQKALASAKARGRKLAKERANVQ